MRARTHLLVVLVLAVAVLALAQSAGAHTLPCATVGHSDCMPYRVAHARSVALVRFNIEVRMKARQAIAHRARLAALARARARLLPAHYAGWMCIHGDPRYGSHYGNEASSWFNKDTGHNGHYGGLQMHPGWGYGTSYYASNDPPLKQMRAAENAYKASGYSSVWLQGQWGQTIGPCWRWFH